MSDDPFYRSLTIAPLRADSLHLANPLWTLRHDHATWSCELRFHGESWGWEAQILRDGELFAGQRFVLRALAQAWAEAVRQILEKGEA